MPESLQAFGLFGLLVAPGLLTVFTVRRLRGSSAESTPDANETILSGIVIAIGVGALEFLLLSLGSWFIPEHRLWGGLEVSELVSSDRWSFIEARAEQVALIASVEYTLHISALIILGWIDPVAWVVNRINEPKWISDDDPYLEAISRARQSLHVKTIYSLVTLESGAQYSGRLVSVSIRPSTQGHREILLDAVRFRPSRREDWEPDEASPFSRVLLSSAHVRSLELTYDLDDVESDEQPVTVVSVTP